MQELTAKIVNTVTESVELNISATEDTGMTLNIKSETSVRVPKNKTDASLLLLLDTNVSDLKNEAIKMHLVNVFEFELSETPENYHECGANICLPIAQKHQFKIIDSVLGNFGLRSTEDD